MTKPLYIIALSGKRFTGKDTFADALIESAKGLGLDIPKGAFAAECKVSFVEEQRGEGRSIDLQRLLDDRVYKEQLRPELTAFTEREIAKDPLVFVRKTLARFEPFGVGLVSDLRLQLELDFLRPNTRLLAVRLERPDALRAQSGWVFVPGTDDHRTETELDGEQQWDLTLVNNGELQDWKQQAQTLAERIYNEVKTSPT
jgi:phosphomevalonate kinase